ncbi:MAG: DUF1844 domain-containing protein [Planctomycetaceae bacterium]
MSEKIIVDDDWKAQVEKEKQMASRPAADLSSDSPTKSDAADIADAAAHSNELPAPPDASFETLVTMLFTQGMAALGQLPGEDNQPMPVNKPFAKHFIDTLEMLGEKTKGNLSTEESGMLGEVLHAMRMTFVSVKASK